MTAVLSKNKIFRVGTAYNYNNNLKSKGWAFPVFIVLNVLHLAPFYIWREEHQIYTRSWFYFNIIFISVLGVIGNWLFAKGILSNFYKMTNLQYFQQHFKTIILLLILFD